ncbi:putative chaperone protein DNAj, partial [Trypanosoma cruzi]
MPPKGRVTAPVSLSPAAAKNGMGGKNDKNKEEKPKKLNAQQVALNNVVEVADRLYKQHEQERVKTETADQISRRGAILDAALEKERLRIDKAEHRKNSRRKWKNGSNLPTGSVKNTAYGAVFHTPHGSHKLI